ncbi:MAG: DUF2310 family Zn-ribbon-containing protein [Bacteroidia bacterium]
MYIQKVSICINSKVDKNEIIEVFNNLTDFYRASGQTQGRIASQFIKGRKIVYMPFTLERKSLRKKYNSLYVNSQIQKLEKLCDEKLEIKTLGKTSADYQGACRCKKPSFYILTTNYVTIESPLTCGSCNQSVPLYRLPVYYDHGYMPILSWETDYISCDSLQMNCRVGERWALNQMQKSDSQLSKQGIEICREIEKSTSVPTYYFLYNYNKTIKDQASKSCPSCGKKWSLKQPIQDCYDFKCDRCRIISTKSFGNIS